MKTVHEVSKLTGVSIRALHYYDTIGLLSPTSVTESGYRLYDDTALERLQHILLFRELEFPLKEIKKILESPSFERNKALKQQIELLTLKKEHLENLIMYARGIYFRGVKNMDFSAFDTSKMDEYAAQVKENWGKTEAYQEYEEKIKGKSQEQINDMSKGLWQLFVEFGELREYGPESDIVQAQVAKLQAFITKNYYNCTNEILSSLGKLYSGGGSFTENIDNAGGEGTAELASEAIAIYCGK